MENNKNIELSNIEVSDIYSDIKEKIEADQIPLLNNIQSINNYDNILFNFLKKNIKKPSNY